uniref:snRNA-activating protein complex subunit 1 n=1 Tax=Clastoptera arizonana TaxID=38151 RepID=A0A1B6ECX1_9HEMI
MFHFISRIENKELNCTISTFINDVTEFLTSIQDKGITSYEEFEKQWKDYNFGIIFAVPCSVKKLSKFVQITLFVLKKMFISKNLEFERVLILYLLYAVYKRQYRPFHHKIEIETSEYKIFFDSMNEILETYEKAKYVFCKFVRTQAFSFVICDEYNLSFIKLEGEKKEEFVPYQENANKYIIKSIEQTLENYNDNLQSLLNNVHCDEKTRSDVKSIDVINNYWNELTSYLSLSPPSILKTLQQEISEQNNDMEPDE